MAVINTKLSIVVTFEEKREGNGIGIVIEIS